MIVSPRNVVAQVNLFLWPTIFYFIGAGLYGFWQYQDTKARLLQEIDFRLSMAANAAVAILPDNFADQALAPDSISPEQDTKNVEKLSRYAWNDDVRYIYTLIKQNDTIFLTSSSATLKEWEEKSYSPYFQSYDEAAPAFHEGFRNRTRFATTYTDRWGNFRTVCLDKYSEQGRFYFACADYDVTYVQDMLMENLRRSLLTAGFFILLGLPFLYVSNQKQKRDTALLQREIDEKSRVQSQLQVLYEELEERVSERTRELEESVQNKQLEVQRREQIQKQLEASEQRLELTIQSAGIGLWDWNLQTGTVNISREWLSMLGYDEADVPPHIDSWRKLIDPQMRPEVEQQLRDHVNGISNIFRVEQRLQCKSGAYKWVLVVGKVVEWNDAGVPLRLLGVHIDIDEAKRASEQIAEARDAAEAGNRAKSEFLAMMSHELRTPLNAIIGFTDRLLGSSLTAQQREFLLRVSSSSKLLFGIIRDILDFSKIEAGKFQLEAEEFFLVDVLKNLDAFFNEQAQLKRLEFSVRCEENVPCNLIGDSVRLTQVLMNLVSNAIKFTDKGRVTVTVSLHRCDEQTAELKFNVTDTGIGISEQQAERIFKPFSQADSSHSRRYGGAGLGLVIAKQLAELMQGTLNYRSEVNVGSEFCLQVSFKRFQSDVCPVYQSSTATTGLAGNKVLLVDDIEVNRELAQEFLRELDIEVVTAINGAEAVSAAICLPFDLVLMDVQMPVMDGLAATAQIRAMGMNLPIIAMTANAMPGDREKCLAAGMNDYLAKPVSLDALQNALKRWLPDLKTRAGNTANSLLPTMESGAEPEIIDEKSALARLGNRTSLYAKLLKAFHESQREQHAMLSNHIAAGEHEKSLLLAHSMKSSAGSIGAQQLSQIAADIEKTLRAGEAVQASLLQQYESSLQQVITELETLRRRYQVA